MKAHFFVSRRAPRYIHELSELSFRSVWMMFRDKEKYIEHERNGKLVAGMVNKPVKTGAYFCFCLQSASRTFPSLSG